MSLWTALVQIPMLAARLQRRKPHAVKCQRISVQTARSSQATGMLQNVPVRMCQRAIQTAARHRHRAFRAPTGFVGSCRVPCPMDSKSALFLPTTLEGQAQEAES